MNKIYLSRKQLASAAFLLLFGGTAVGISEHYNAEQEPDNITPETAAITAAQVPDAAAGLNVLATDTNAAALLAAATEAAEEAFIPNVVQLNLAYLYPEGADDSDPLNSKAGAIFRKLMEKDEAWMSHLFDLSDSSPEQMATRLGKSRKSVMGHYNPNDEKHDSDDPDTWTINSFKKVHMQYLDGDGKTSGGFSNVGQIMSMASVYTWFEDMEDDAAFQDYVLKLWEQSHSYTVSMGEVYYCDGCVGEDGEELEREELLAEDALERAALEQAAAVAGSIYGFDMGLSGTNGTETEAESSAGTPAKSKSSAGPAAAIASRAAAESGSAAADAADEETGSSADAAASAAESSAESAALASETEVVSETDISGQAEQDMTTAAATAGSVSMESSAAETAEDSVGETASQVTGAAAESAADTPGSGPGVSLASASNAMAEVPESQTAKAATKEKTKCPGHVDLYVKAKVVGLDEKRNLFGIDSVGNNDKNKTGHGWEGWNTYTKSYATRLSNQDWYERYGLSVSSLSMRNPLSASEIDAYLQDLPSYLSAEKRKMIQFALSSVGKVPYYWGGKAVSAGYEGNQFGVLTTSDSKGRILRGLDCSGWINWVYWSSTGERLPYESTSGLATCGTRVSRSQLEPGDIVLRTGDNAHVIMFLGWTDDGRILCVQETSGNVNNVTVSVRDANWPYYRRIID